MEWHASLAEEADGRGCVVDAVSAENFDHGSWVFDHEQHSVMVFVCPHDGPHLPFVEHVLVEVGDVRIEARFLLQISV